jgi:hypothetical protein
MDKVELRGEAVRNDVLEKLATALSKKHSEVTVLAIPHSDSPQFFPHFLHYSQEKSHFFPGLAIQSEGVPTMGNQGLSNGNSSQHNRTTPERAWRCAYHGHFCSLSSSLAAIPPRAEVHQNRRGGALQTVAQDPSSRKTSGSRPEYDMAKAVIKYTKTPSGGTSLTVYERALCWLVVLVLAIAAIVLGADLRGMVKLLLH